MGQLIPWNYYYYYLRLINIIFGSLILSSVNYLPFLLNCWITLNIPTPTPAPCLGGPVAYDGNGDG